MLSAFLKPSLQFHRLFDLLRADLDVENIREEASARWLRPNEIHAILCNYKYFTIHVKPVNLPKSKIVLCNLSRPYFTIYKFCTQRILWFNA